MAAITAVCEAGFPFEEVCQAADSLKLPEGRMQQIPNELGITIIIDYAHTAEAFRAILQTVRFQTEKRVIVVFSCGGERDHAKRPKMGLMASKFSDFIVLTHGQIHSFSSLIKMVFQQELQDVLQTVFQQQVSCGVILYITGNIISQRALNGGLAE